jgi:hypothetical protein
MAVNFLDPETTELSHANMKTAGPLSSLTKSEISSLIKTSNDVSGIELRMLPPLIKDNHTPSVWPFPGFSNLYCLTMVVSDIPNQSVGNIDLKGFPRIGDQEHLPINKTIFYWQSKDKKDDGPNQIHTMCSVLKSKKDLRDVGNVLATVKEDSEYKGLMAAMAEAARDAAKFNLVTDIIVQVAGIIGKHLGKVEDKPLGTIINSYTTLHGDFDKIGIAPLLYSTKDVDFQFQMIVRNKTVETEIEEKIVSNKTFPFKKEQLNLATEEMVEVDMVPM